MSKPPLWNLANAAYHAVMNHAPESLQKRDKASAAFLGFAGTLSLTTLALESARRFTNRTFRDDEFSALEATCALIGSVCAIGYATLKPKETTEIMTEHPTYTAGIAGSFGGFFVSIIDDLYRHYGNRQA